MGDAKNTKSLSKIKSGLFSRTWSLAKMGYEASRLAKAQVQDKILGDDMSELLSPEILKRLDRVAGELGQLKGSLMKVGQMLSVYGEHFLPAEANRILKSLQFESPPLEWNEIHKMLKRNLKPEQLQQLEIEQEPTASASIGQVHRGKIKSSGTPVAVKIQYPGVEKAIDSDLKTLKSILTLSKFVPSTPRLDHLFDEVRDMLYQEVDYKREAEATEWFRERLSQDERYIVPCVFPDLSSQRVLVSEFQIGMPVDSPVVKSLSQERRDRLAEHYLDLYFRELFLFKKVQTDPHIGNYKIKVSPDGDRLICFDFGAVRDVPDFYLENYIKIIQGSLRRDRNQIVEGATALGILLPGDSEKLITIYCDLCYLIVEPYARPTQGVPFMEPNGMYDWGKSDLPKRVARKAWELKDEFSLRSPPKESVFLDRKLGGSFTFLAILNTKLDGRSILERYIEI